MLFIDVGAVQFLDKVVDVPVAARQVCVVEIVQVTVVVPQLQLLWVSSSSWTMLLTSPLLCTSGVGVQTVPKSVEIPHVAFLDKVVDVLVAVHVVSGGRDRTGYCGVRSCCSSPWCCPVLGRGC